MIVSGDKGLVSAQFKADSAITRLGVVDETRGIIYDFESLGSTDDQIVITKYDLNYEYPVVFSLDDAQFSHNRLGGRISFNNNCTQLVYYGVANNYCAGEAYTQGFFIIDIDFDNFAASTFEFCGITTGSNGDLHTFIEKIGTELIYASGIWDTTTFSINSFTFTDAVYNPTLIQNHAYTITAVAFQVCVRDSKYYMVLHESTDIDDGALLVFDTVTNTYEKLFDLPFRLSFIHEITSGHIKIAYQLVARGIVNLGTFRLSDGVEVETISTTATGMETVFVIGESQILYTTINGASFTKYQIKETTKNIPLVSGDIGLKSTTFKTGVEYGYSVLSTWVVDEEGGYIYLWRVGNIGVQPTIYMYNLNWNLLGSFTSVDYLTGHTKRAKFSFGTDKTKLLITDDLGSSQFNIAELAINYTTFSASTVTNFSRTVGLLNAEETFYTLGQIGDFVYYTISGRDNINLNVVFYKVNATNSDPSVTTDSGIKGQVLHQVFNYTEQTVNLVVRLRNTVDIEFWKYDYNTQVITKSSNTLTLTGLTEDKVSGTRITKVTNGEVTLLYRNSDNKVVRGIFDHNLNLFEENISVSTFIDDFTQTLFIDNKDVVHNTTSIYTLQSAETTKNIPLASGDIGLETVSFQDIVGDGVLIDAQTGHTVYDYERELLYFVLSSSEQTVIQIYQYDKDFNFLGVLNSSTDFVDDIRSPCRYNRFMLNEDGTKLLVSLQNMTLGDELGNATTYRVGSITIDFDTFSDSTISLSGIMGTLGSNKGLVCFEQIGDLIYSVNHNGAFTTHDVSDDSSVATANFSCDGVLGWTLHRATKRFYALVVKDDTDLYLLEYDYINGTLTNTSANTLDLVLLPNAGRYGMAFIVNYDEVLNLFRIAYAQTTDGFYQVGLFDKDLNLKTKLQKLVASYSASISYRRNLFVQLKDRAVAALVDRRNLYTYREKQTTKQ